MMTFDEFLKKKKIDPVQLQKAEPSLFSEFNSHFGQMGEKSFDHSKKFWFNKLRRSYHLTEEPKVVPAKEVIEINEIASQAEPLISPTLEATGVPPRFKPRVASTAPEQKTEESDSVQKPKPAFVPRFKANITPPAEPAAPPQETSTEPTAEAAKPAFKPRFKAATTPPVPQEPVEENKAETETSKPAYAPRFKANITPPEAGKLTGEIKVESVEGQAEPAFKPRFNANLTKSAAPINESEDKAEATATPESQADTDESAAEPAKPAAYKPRFKPSMVKPKDPEE
jgi:hypothetical protein